MDSPDYSLFYYIFIYNLGVLISLDFVLSGVRFS